MFIGYPHGQKGWRVYDIESGDIFVSRDVTFDEATFPFASSLGHDEVDRSQPSPCHMGEDDSMGLWGSKPVIWTSRLPSKTGLFFRRVQSQLGRMSRPAFVSQIPHL